MVDSDAWGGAEEYVRLLLRRANANGWSASLVCASPVAGGLAGSADAVQVVPLARHCRAAPEVERALRAQAPDVVLVNLVDPASNAAALGAGLAVAPTVATLHLAGAAPAGPARERLAGLYRRLAAVLTPSRDARDALIADLDVDGERIVVVPNGIDLPPEPTGPAGGRPVRVGGLGRLTGQKGFDVLVDATRALVGDGTPLEVRVAGTGRDADRLAAAARGLPVALPGFVPDPWAFLAGLDVFCLPSRREAMPLALLEAMASGLPCVATDVGAVRDAVDGAAVVVPPEDPRALAGGLRGLVRDSERRTALGRRARAHAVRHFDADVMARRTYAILDRARTPTVAPAQR